MKMAVHFVHCLLFALSVHAGPSNNQRSKYTIAHSIDTREYQHPKLGWQNINITNLQYKYESIESYRSQGQHNTTTKRSLVSIRAPLAAKNNTASKHNNQQSIVSELGNTVVNILGHLVKGLKALGKAQPVLITWYTGQDLLNPSCWANGKWHPTDKSFVAALTLEGWTTKPKCFSFLELCNGPKKCIFVRVVDTCAGCKKGSKHVDLTRAAFKELADFDTGILTVQLRAATIPKDWFEDLWGPKH